MNNLKGGETMTLTRSQKADVLIHLARGGELPTNPKVHIGTLKKCTKCLVEKPVDEFYKESKGKDELRSDCKRCTNKKTNRWRKKNPEKWMTNQAIWHKNNLEKANANSRKWNREHPEKHIASSIKWRKSKLKNYLSSCIGSAIRKSLKGNKKGRSWENLVGYSVEDLQKHIEKQFKLGMTWENYGKWHIDHIIPKDVFNFSCPEDIDFRHCWALKNLQPLWALENIFKHNKLSKSFQPCLTVKLKKLPLCLCWCRYPISRRPTWISLENPLETQQWPIIFCPTCGEELAD